MKVLLLRRLFLKIHLESCSDGRHIGGDSDTGGPIEVVTVSRALLIHSFDLEVSGLLRLICCLPSCAPSFCGVRVVSQPLTAVDVESGHDMKTG